MLLTNIRRLCSKKPVSIAKLEKATGISNGTISRWNKSSPTIENVQKVAEFFGVTVNDLLSPMGEAEKQEQ